MLEGKGAVVLLLYAGAVVADLDEVGAVVFKLDLDGSGDIDRDELSMMLRKLGFEWQGAHIFEMADTNGDGKVDFDEFVACFGPAAASVKGKTAVTAAKGKIKPGKGKAVPPPAAKAPDVGKKQLQNKKQPSKTAGPAVVQRAARERKPPETFKAEPAPPPAVLAAQARRKGS